MRITFIRDWKVQQGDGKGAVYRAGETHAFVGRVAETYARKYVQRGYAVAVADEPAAPPPSTAKVAPPADPPSPILTAAELLSAVEGDPPMEWNAFKAAAQDLLGDATPAKKAEIVAALQAMAAADAPADPPEPAA